MGNSKGMTMLTLVITAVMLILVAGITITMSIGNSGILTRSSQAAKDAQISNEKEQILVSFNDTKRDKLVDDDFSIVTVEELEDTLNNAGADVSLKSTIGDNIIITYLKSGRAYLIDQEGHITAAPENGAAGNGRLNRGSGTSADPYMIQSVEDLVTLSQWAKNGNTNGKYFKLSIDLNMAYPWSYVNADGNELNIDVNGNGNYDGMMEEMGTGKGFSPIGTSSSPFKGYFDGNGRTITKLNIKNNQNGLGFFGVVENGSISNLTIAEASVENQSGQNTAILVGEYRYSVSTTINNCTIEGTTRSGNTSGAGLIGKLTDNSSMGVNFTIDSCNVDSKVINQQGYNAIFAGNTSLKSGSTIDIKNSEANGVVTVSGGDYHAGFVGYANSGNVRFENCKNNASVTSSQASNNMAGYGNFGNVAVVIKSCLNKGSITTGNGTNSGGFISKCTGSINIEKCDNEGAVTGGSGVGGFIGTVSASSSNIKICKNGAPIRGNENVGGFIGSDAKSKLTDCYNTGYVQTVNGRVGGIIGYSSGNTSLVSVINSGIVTGPTAGGIAGQVANLTKCQYAFNLGSISATTKAAAIFNYSSTTGIDNCYYLKDTADTWNGTNAENINKSIRMLDSEAMSAQLSDFATAQENWDVNASGAIRLINLPAFE